MKVTSSLITKLKDTQDVQIVHDHQPLFLELYRTDQIHKVELDFLIVFSFALHVKMWELEIESDRKIAIFIDSKHVI